MLRGPFGGVNRRRGRFVRVTWANRARIERLSPWGAECDSQEGQPPPVGASAALVAEAHEAEIALAGA